MRNNKRQYGFGENYFYSDVECAQAKPIKFPKQHGHPDTESAHQVNGFDGNDFYGDVESAQVKSTKIPKHLGHPDTESAHQVKPWESCCPTPTGEKCECVTSADVEMWNQISAFSGINPESLSGISAFEEIAASANLWNDTFETVSSNSANWDYAYSSIDPISAQVSGILNELKDKFKVKTTKDLYGNGTKEDPLGIVSAEFYKKLITKLNYTLGEFFDKNGNPLWMNKEEGKEIFKSIEYLANENQQQWFKINWNRDKILYLIENSEMYKKYKILPEKNYETLDKIKTLNEPNTIYYLV